MQTENDRTQKTIARVARVATTPEHHTGDGRSGNRTARRKQILEPDRQRQAALRHGIQARSVRGRRSSSAGANGAEYPSAGSSIEKCIMRESERSLKYRIMNILDTYEEGLTADELSDLMNKPGSLILCVLRKLKTDTLVCRRNDKWKVAFENN